MDKKIKRIIKLLLKEYLLKNIYNFANKFKSNFISRTEFYIKEESG